MSLLPVPVPSSPQSVLAAIGLESSEPLSQDGTYIIGGPMLAQCWLPLALAAARLSPPVPNVLACCPAPPSGRPVVNADQTVVIVWDAATKTEHFIRRASFKAE